MRPGARAAAAIALLDQFEETRAPIDRLLTEWGRGARYAGAKDRAAVSDLVHLGLRRWRSAAADFGPTGRGRLIGALIADGLGAEAVTELFAEGGHGPAPLSTEERRRVAGAAAARAAGAPEPGGDPAERGDWPAWLWPELARSTETPEEELAALKRRRPLDLRVNTLKATIAEARGALEADGVAVAPAPLSPLGLRSEKPRPLRRISAYLDGLVEVQDAGSQAAAALAGAAPGETVLDYCAGGGGKTLALAASMAGEGRLYAFDVARRRMADARPRLARAGAQATILDRPGALSPLEGRCDLVFVDAPCSGTGAWARRPDGRWRLSPETLAELRDAQSDALESAAAYTRPGGRLAYVTCSLLRSENADQAAAFLARRPDFAPRAIAPAWRAAGLLGATPEGEDIALTPARHGADGFYIALFERRRIA